MIANLFYINNFNSIGGTESFLYYLVRKYKDKDIVVIYKDGDINQINRLKKYVRVKKYDGEKIECERAFFNYNLDIIDSIEAKEYIQIIHTDFKEQKRQPNINSKINKYIGVSQTVCDSFEEITYKKCELCYNPIIYDKPKKVLTLISVTRLTPEKGRDRIITLGKELNKYNIPYIWLIFTNDSRRIDNPNIVYMQPKLDIIDYIANSDYLVQLSNQGEGYGYSIVEALSVGTPVICTPCSSFIEIGVKNDENGFILNFDMSDIDIKKIYESRLKFNYEPKKDIWNKILINKKSEYQKYLKQKVKIECIKKYFDIEYQEWKNMNSEPYETNMERAEYLVDVGVAKIIK